MRKIVELVLKVTKIKGVRLLPYRVRVRLWEYVEGGF